MRDFPLQGFNKHPHWFRCSGKRKHLNLAARQNLAVNPLTTSALQDFRQLCPWFRSQLGLEHRRLHICHGGTSERGIHERCNRTAHASEPELNPRNPLQFIEKLSVARIQQASPPVQMQWKSGASEPCGKTESGSQTAHNKRVARLSATVPMVQIPGRSWNAAECKCTLEVFLARVSTKHATEQPMHLNRDRTRKIHCNSLRNFLLHGFSKHPHWFRCSGKVEHLNPAARQNPVYNTLITNVLQDFRQLCPWFRSQPVLECRGMQTCPGGASGWGIRQTRSRVAQASEPRQNSKNPLQLIERLSVAWFQQASPLVQMQWKSGASEPCGKAESGIQHTHNKRVARLSAIMPMVQIPTCFGTPRNANVPCRCFLQGYPPNARQHCPRI